MRTRSFLVALVVGLGGCGVLLAMAAVLDVPALRFVAVAFLLGGILAREAWMWRGERRTALVMLAFILGVIVVAFAVQRLSA